VPLWTGEIDWNSTGIAVLKAKTADNSVREERSGTNRTADIHDLLNWLWSGKTQVINSIKEIDIVGHRVVHGGEKYRQPMSIDAEVKAEIDRLSIYAPLHNPANLMEINIIESLAPNIPQVAVFDTAFHGDLPKVAYVYPVPYQWLERGIRKYGFQDIYIDRLTSKIGSLLPNLGGVDALIFTGGVGENHAGIRAAVAAKLAFIGVEIDPVLNSLPMTIDSDLATSKSQVRILTIHTQEEWQIAMTCAQYSRSIF
jgi:acetate kinase